MTISRRHTSGIARVLHLQAFKLFCVEQSGATVVEFALVALPLFFLLFATLELGLIFILNLNLANATASLGRELRVGQIVAPGSSVSSSSGQQVDLSDFKAAICNQIALVPNATCMSQLQVDVRTLSSFQNQSPPNPISGKTFSTTGFCYYSGPASSVVELRAYYSWPIVTPVLLNSLVNVTTIVSSGGSNSGSWIVVSSNQVFKNEPSSSISNTGNGC